MAIRRQISVLTTLLLVSAPAFGQLPDTGGDEPAPSALPAGLENPRATFNTFFAGMSEASPDMAMARSTMDLSAISGVRRVQEGNRLAAAMLDVINRSKWVVMEEVPDQEDGPPYTFFAYDGDKYAITISKGADGAWRFTSETVSQIDSIYNFVHAEGWNLKENPAGETLRAVDQIQANPSGWLSQKFPSNWQTTHFLGAKVWQIVAALILIAVAFIAGALIRLITRWIVRSSLKVDEEIASKKKIGSLGRGLSLIVNVVLIGAGLPFLDFPPFLLTPTLFALKVANAIGWLWVFYIVWDIFVAFAASKAAKKSKSAKNVIVPIASKFGRFFIFIGVLVFFIAQLGYDVTALLAGLGIGGLVFALAAKDSVENLFGSITILMEMPFGVGDWVKIGDIDGDVEAINLRSTRIRTFQDSLITLPNSRMITSHVENFGMRRRRRIKTTLGLSYDTPPAKVAEFCERVRQMLLDDERIWNDKRYVYFNDFGESTLNVMLYCFLIAETWQLELEYRDDVLRKIMLIAEDMGVEFAYPTLTLLGPGGEAPKIPAG